MTGDAHRIVPAGTVNPTSYKILIPEGYNIQYLVSPSRFGYAFDDYSTKQSKQAAGSIVVDNSTIYNHSTHGDNLYANWKPITYIIRFDPATASYTGSMQDIIATYGETRRLPRNMFQVYRASFSNWIDERALDTTKTIPELYPRVAKEYDDEANVINLRSTQSEIVILKAVWGAGNYTIAYNKNTPVSPGGFTNTVQGTMASQRVRRDLTAPLSDNRFTLAGYRFIGWSRTPLTPIQAEAIEHDTTQYYTNRQSVALGALGLDTVTLYAMWGRNRYTLTLAQNESLANIPDPYATVSYIYYDQLLSDNPAFSSTGKVRNHYQFTGKFTTTRIAAPYARRTYNGTNYVTITSVNRTTGNVTLYPLWQNDEVQITMHAGEGSIPAGYADHFTGYIDAPYYSVGPAGEPKNANGTLINCIATTGRIFRAWATDAAGTNIINANTILVDSSNLNVYAIYGDTYSVTVTFNPGGGTGNMSAVSVRAGVPFTVSRCNFTKSRYVFDHWRSNTGEIYYPGNTIVIYGNITLTAHWAREKSPGGGSGGGSGSGGGIPAQQQITANVTWGIDPITGELFAVDQNGTPVKGWQYVRDQDSGTSWHFFTDNGISMTGCIDDGTGIYYLDINGKMVTGVKDINGKVYEFNSSGQLIGESTGLNPQIVVNRSASSNTQWVYIPATNKWQYSVGGSLLINTFFTSNVTGTDCWYAVDNNGNMLTGLVKKDGAVYYLQEQGSNMGMLVAGTSVTIGGIAFETDTAGKVIGDLSIFGGMLNIYDMDQYANNANGLNAQAGDMSGADQVEGFVNAGNGIFYYMMKEVDASGKTTFKKATGIMNINGLYYYFDENGVMATGLKEVNGKLYYFIETGEKIGSVYVGNITVDGTSYYCDPNDGGAATKLV